MNRALLNVNVYHADTVKAFLEKNKLGKYNEEEMKRKAEEKKQEEEAEERLARSCKVGDRCEVFVLNQPTRRATILYVGQCNMLNEMFSSYQYIKILCFSSILNNISVL